MVRGSLNSGSSSSGSRAEAVEDCGSSSLTSVTCAGDGASFTGCVGSGGHTPEAMENDAGNGVDHRGECGDG